METYSCFTSQQEKKQIELISQLAEGLGILDIEKKYERAQSRIPMSTQDVVINFYYRDNISYQTPGRRDSITIKMDGVKQILQKNVSYCFRY